MYRLITVGTDVGPCDASSRARFPRSIVVIQRVTIPRLRKTGAERGFGDATFDRTGLHPLRRACRRARLPAGDRPDRGDSAGFAGLGDHQAQRRADRERRSDHRLRRRHVVPQEQAWRPLVRVHQRLPQHPAVLSDPRDPAYRAVLPPSRRRGERRRAVQPDLDARDLAALGRLPHRPGREVPQRLPVRWPARDAAGVGRLVRRHQGDGLLRLPDGRQRNGRLLRLRRVRLSARRRRAPSRPVHPGLLTRPTPLPVRRADRAARSAHPAEALRQRPRHRHAAAKLQRARRLGQAGVGTGETAPHQSAGVRRRQGPREGVQDRDGGRRPGQDGVSGAFRHRPARQHDDRVPYRQRVPLRRASAVEQELRLPRVRRDAVLRPVSVGLRPGGLSPDVEHRHRTDDRGRCRHRPAGPGGRHQHGAAPEGRECTLANEHAPRVRRYPVR